MPDVLVDSAITPELLETQVSHELVSEVEALQVLEQATLEVVVETQTTTELVDATETNLLIEVAVQGPPGAQGPAGPPGPPGVGATFDPSTLTPAGSARPDEVIVRQGSDWFRGTFAQLRNWLGLLGVVVNGRPITVNSAQITVGAD